MQNGLAIYVTPSESVVDVLWHIFGSFVLLRGLDGVVATAAAEERDEAFTVPFEAAVAFLIGSIAAVGTGAAASGLSEFSVEKSSAKWFVSIKRVIEATIIWSMGTYQPAVDRAKLQTQFFPMTESRIHRIALRPNCLVQANSVCLP